MARLYTSRAVRGAERLISAGVSKVQPRLGLLRSLASSPPPSPSPDPPGLSDVSEHTEDGGRQAGTRSPLAQYKAEGGRELGVVLKRC